MKKCSPQEIKMSIIKKKHKNELLNFTTAIQLYKINNTICWKYVFKLKQVNLKTG